MCTKRKREWNEFIEELNAIRVKSGLEPFTPRQALREAKAQRRRNRRKRRR